MATELFLRKLYNTFAPVDQVSLDAIRPARFRVALGVGNSGFVMNIFGWWLE